MRGTQFSIFPFNKSMFALALPTFFQQLLLALRFLALMLLPLVLVALVFTSVATAAVGAGTFSQPYSSALPAENVLTSEDAEAVTQKKLRIVSMNYCIDFVLSRWQNEAFEFYPVAEHHGRIEKIMQLSPDMIIAGQFNSPIRISNFRNNGLPVAVLDEPNSFSGARRFFQELAALLQQPELAQADIQEISTPAVLADASEGSRQTVLAMQVNQWSFGGNNLLNELFEHMGLENLAARKGDGLVKVGLEDILQWQPDILLLEGKLITSEPNDQFKPEEHCADNQGPCVQQAPRSFALANLNLMHKSLRNYSQQPHVQSLYLPSEVSGCMAQRLPEAIHMLSQQLQQHRQGSTDQ